MSIESVNEKFYNLLDKAITSNLFHMKCQSLCDTLEANQSELQSFLENNNTELNEGQLDELNALLNELSDKIKYLNDQNLFWSYLQENVPIEELIIGISSRMDKLNALLQKIGVEDPTKLPSDKFREDYLQIFDSLDNYINMLQKRKKEVTTILNQCSINHVNLSNESINQILDRYDEYRYKKEDFVKGDRLYYSVGPFDYYNGAQKDNKAPVILMKLLDNHFLARIFEVLTQLKHDYVESFIGFYDENEDEDESREPEITIVTKRVGIDLFSFLHSNEKSRQKWKFDPGDRTILSYKIAQAMSYVHSRNIIHRNLTTSSVYFEKEGNEINPMIVSFRSSRPMAETVNPQYTVRNKCLYDGNPSNFFAPEYDNSTQYDEKIDVFSFAGILYELATGESPFSNCDEEETKSLLKSGKRPQFNKGTNSDLVNLIEHCWDPEPKKRYSFNDIMKEMSKKNIIFDNDVSKKDEIVDFYRNSNSNRNKINNGIEIIENTKKDIANAYQYKHLLLRTRTKLNLYQSFLNHEFNPENSNSDEDNDKIDDLIDLFDKYSSVVSKALYDNWITMADTLPVKKIPEDVIDLIQSIDEIIKELGFSGDDDPYQQSKNDLIFDFRELYFAFENDHEHFDEKISKQKRKEVIQYLKSKDPNYLKEIKNPSKQQTYQRIVDLFSNFNAYERQCQDFTKDFEIQSGKNSKVFEGYIVQGAQPVAIKVFNGNELGKSEQNLFNLRREVEYLTKVNHKYIAKFVGYAIDKNTCDVWIITELAKSGTMRQILKNEISHLSGDEKTMLAFKLAKAMSYLKSNQIVHRGLTTSNIVLEGKKPKLIDFGNASPDIKGVEGDVNDNATLDAVEYDTKDDVFAYSMILYEMLTGELPNANNYRFNVEEDLKSDLQKLIESGLQNTNQDSRTFDHIINKMINNQIMFPGANKETICAFYNKKRAKC